MSESSGLQGSRLRSCCLFAAVFLLACQADDDPSGADAGGAGDEHGDERGDADVALDAEGSRANDDHDASSRGADAHAEASSGASSDAALATGDASAAGAGSSTPSRGLSAGCGRPVPSGDSTTAWSKHDLMVSGVASRFLMGGDKYGNQHGYDFSHRNFFVRLPAKYAESKPYALVISAPGCGATDGISGNNGGSNPLPDRQDVAVQVGLSYVYPNGAGACFADGSSDTPDLPYFDAVMAELEKAYCFDRDRVFVSGFSSGAWETYMLACARAGVIRGIGTQAGGLRKERPMCAGKPVAAFLTAGVNDDNPIQNIDASGFDTGSQAARDVILKTNGCLGKESAPYLTEDAPADWHCVSYTGCPKEFPVVWCAITADGGRHGAGSNKAFWPFWSALAAP
jgi:polyhydroxybutyrate depolymerase